MPGRKQSSCWPDPRSPERLKRCKARTLTHAAAFAAYLMHAPDAVKLPLFAACGGTIAHFLCTAKAAPNMLSLRNAGDDELFLAGKLDAFATWHAYRALFQFLTFVAPVWALVAISRMA